MKIKSVTLEANHNKIYKLDPNITVIFGSTSDGKTLLFKLFEYAFGAGVNNIDIPLAQKTFEGLSAISIKFDNEILIRRMISKDMKATIIKNGITEEFFSERNYKDAIKELFQHKDVKVANDGASKRMSTFTIREYVKTLFFSEERIVDQSTLAEREGYTMVVKNKNFYKYLVTGKYIDTDAIENIKKISQDNEIENAVTLLSKQVVTPQANILKQRDDLIQKKENRNNEISDLNSNINELDKDILVLVINNEKMKSLIALYESEKHDLLLAKQMEEFLSESTIVCEKCHNHIPLMRQEVDEDMIKDIESRIERIYADYRTNTKEIDKQKNKRKELIDKVDALKHQIFIDEKELAEISNTIHEYDVFIKMKELFVQKKERKIRTEIQINYDEIENSFKDGIESICNNVANRLVQWGLTKYTTVSFSFDKFDLVFDDTLRTLLPKGYKSLCTNAFIIELVLHMKRINIPCFDFILIDTLWCVSYIRDYPQEDLMINIISNLKNLDLQIIILENTRPASEISCCKYLHI